VYDIASLKEKYLNAISKILNEEFDLVSITTDAMINKKEQAKDLYESLSTKCINKLDMSKEELNTLIPHLGEMAGDIAKMVLLRLNRKE